VICTYEVRPDAYPEFVELLRQHWPTLHALGGVTDEPARIYKSLEPANRIVEIFTWRDGGFAVAKHPDVVAIWERMELLCDEMSFPHFEELSLSS
jgi:hypothetical protein